MNQRFDIEVAALPPLPGALGDVSILTPIRLATATQLVTERLVGAISLGEFASGERLPSVRQLATLLGVNQSSIREALQRLSTMGYVRIVRGRSGGAYVANVWGPDAADAIHRALLPDAEMLEYLVDLRRLIEPLAAHVAALRHTEEDAAAMIAARTAHAEAISSREASRAADHALHTAIAAATKNPCLLRVSLQLRGPLSLGLRSAPYTRAQRERALEQHAELVAAIVDGDPAAAAEIAHEHIWVSDDDIRAAIDRIKARRSEQPELHTHAEEPDATAASW